MSGNFRTPPSVFPLRSNGITWLTYLVFVCGLAWFFFGDLRHFPTGIHDDDVFADNIDISEDFTYLFSAEKRIAGGRPASEFVLWLSYLIWGNDPGRFHLVVVGFHTLASILLAVMCRQMRLSMGLSFLSGILFLIHVGHFQAVHWISALIYPLALIFALTAIVCYLHFMESRRRPWLACFYVSLLTAVLAHPAIVVLCLFCLYWSWHQKHELKRAVKSLLPFGLVLVPLNFFILSITSRQTSTWEFIDASADLLTRISSAGSNFVWFLGRLFIVAHWLPVTIYKRQDWEWWICVPVFVFLVWLLWRGRQPAAAWALWIFLTLLPFAFVALVAQGTRYLYLASAGSSALLAWIIESAFLWGEGKIQPLRRCTYALTLAVFLGSSYIAHEKTEVFSLYGSAKYKLASGNIEQGVDLLKSSIELGNDDLIPLDEAYFSLLNATIIQGQDYRPLLSEALEKVPGDLELKTLEAAVKSLYPDPALRESGLSFIRKLEEKVIRTDQVLAFHHMMSVIYSNIGHGFYTNEDYARAIEVYRLSLQYEPHRSNAFKGLIHALLQSGQHEEAARTVLLRAKDMPDEGPILNSILYSNLGDLYYDQQQYERAASAYRQAIQLEPRNPQLHANLGTTLQALDQSAQAEQAYRTAIEIQPDNPVFYHNLGALAFASGDREGALEAFAKAAQLQYDHIGTYWALGRLYGETGQIEKALETYLLILEKDFKDGNSAIYTTIGIQLYQADQIESAARAFRKALAEDADDLVARVNLGWISFLQEQYDLAIHHFQTALAKQSHSVAQFNLGLAYLARGDTAAARRTYAEAVQRFGREEGKRIGVVDDLENLIGRNIQTAVAREILATYWD